jgi:hypothetical protein
MKKILVIEDQPEMRRIKHWSLYVLRNVRSQICQPPNQGTEEMGDYIWISSQIVAEIKFGTRGDVLRHPEFVMLCADKDPKRVARE